MIGFAGKDYARLGTGLGSLFFVAVCIGTWLVAKVRRDREERQYGLIILAYQLNDAATGAARALIPADINALPSATERQTVSLMADGQTMRTAQMAPQASDDEIQRLTTQVLRDRDEILRSTAFAREVRLELLNLATFLSAGRQGAQSRDQAGDVTQRGPENSWMATPSDIVVYVVAELRRLAELALAA